VQKKKKNLPKESFQEEVIQKERKMTKSSKYRTLDPMPLLDPDLLLSEFKKLKIKPIHAQKIWRCWIQHSQSYDSIPQIPLDALELLKSKFTHSTSKVISRQDARDGSTTKLLIELQDGQRIESVIMRYGQVTLEKFPMEELEKKKDGLFKSNGRATLCVSSQVGCSMGCTFCATGTMGLLSHLSCGEILEQLVHANKIEKIRNGTDVFHHLF
jgi:sorting nexin-8